MEPETKTNCNEVFVPEIKVEYDSETSDCENEKKWKAAPLAEGTDVNDINEVCMPIIKEEERFESSECGNDRWTTKQEEECLTGSNNENMERTIDIEKLIHEVRAQPSVWDMTHTDYNDKSKRNKAWDEIINAFAEDNTSLEEKIKLGDLLHKKWKNVRDRYAREIRARKGKSSSGVVKKAPYIFTQQMSFLQDMVLPRKNSTPDEEVREKNSGSSNEPGPSNQSVPTQERRQPIAKKKSTSSLEAKIFEALEYNTQKRQKIEEDEGDDNRLFLLSLLPLLKSVPRHLNLQARLEMMQCVMKYEMQLNSQGQPNICATSCMQLNHSRQQVQEIGSLSSSPQQCSRTSATVPSPAESVTSASADEEDSDISVF